MQVIAVALVLAVIIGRKLNIVPLCQTQIEQIEGQQHYDSLALVSAVLPSRSPTHVVSCRANTADLSYTKD